MNQSHVARVGIDDHRVHDHDPVKVATVESKAGDHSWSGQPKAQRSIAMQPLEIDGLASTKMWRSLQRRGRRTQKAFIKIDRPDWGAFTYPRFVISPCVSGSRLPPARNG